MSKKKKLRSYNWELIIWNEHYKDDLDLRIKISDEIHAPCILSPLHDKDKYTDGNLKGELKKPHYHLLISFDNQKTLDQLIFLDKSFNDGEGNNLNIVLSRGGATRYLTHDGYEIPNFKFKYPNEDIQEFGGAEYHKWFFEASGTKIEIIFKLIRENEFTSYGQLIKAISENENFTYLLDEATKKAFSINQYINYKNNEKSKLKEMIKEQEQIALEEAINKNTEIIDFTIN